jgi:glycosyltransferase involved in cell wall biosynthesis
MIADDDAKFAESVVRLLSDPALRESLSREARLKVEAENSWQSVATQYEAVYRDALGQPGSTKDR